MLRSSSTIRIFSATVIRVAERLDARAPASVRGAGSEQVAAAGHRPVVPGGTEGIPAGALQVERAVGDDPHPDAAGIDAQAPCLLSEERHVRAPNLPPVAAVVDA